MKYAWKIMKIEKKNFKRKGLNERNLLNDVVKVILVWYVKSCYTNKVVYRMKTDACVGLVGNRFPQFSCIYLLLIRDDRCELEQ